MVAPFVAALAPIVVCTVFGAWHARRRLRPAPATVVEASPPDDPLADPDPAWAQLLFDEWKLRQEHFWSSLFRWGGTIVALTIVPYIKPELATSLKGAVLLFPSLAVAMACFGAWHLAAEYARQRVVGSMLDRARKNYTPEWTFGGVWWHRPLQMNLGWVTPVILLVGSLYISAWNFLLLVIRYRNVAVASSWYWLLGGIGGGLAIYAMCFALSELGTPRRRPRE